MTERGITRRQALRCLAAIGSLPLAGVACGAHGEAERLVALRRDRRSAQRVGRAWLDAQSPPPDAARLVALICGASGCAGFASGGEPLRREVAQRHHSDLARGKLVAVEGWLLTETEAALYALVALSASGRRPRAARR
jgi:hypothetical protein